MDSEWQKSFDSIKSKHDLAFKTIVVAKRHDAAANYELAIVNYKISVELIDDALATPVALPDDPIATENDQSWSIALEMIQKMKRTRAELIQRIGVLSEQSSQTIDDEVEVNDLIDETDVNSDIRQQRPRTFMELAEALQNLEYNSAVLPNVLELLFSCDGVTLYHINVNGEVSTTDESSTLRIIRLDQDLKQNFEATYFMQIIPSSMAEKIKRQDVMGSEQEEQEEAGATACAGSEASVSSSKVIDGHHDVSSIIYPLVPGVSPCYRTEFGAFIFPDLEADVPGSAFGFVITSGHDEIVLEILEAILHGVVRQGQTPVTELEPGDEELEERRARKVRESSEVISENILKGACIISNGLVKGSEQVGKFVSFTTPYLMSKMNKAPPATVPSKVVGGVEIAKCATSKAASVTGYVAGKVGTATMALGRFLAPHVHTQGSKLLSSAMGISNDEAADKVNIIRKLKTKVKIMGNKLEEFSSRLVECSL